MSARRVVLSFFLVMAAAAGFVRAEDWYLKGNQGGDALNPFTTPSCWTNLAKQTCQTIRADDVFRVEAGHTLTVGIGTTFEPTLHLGKPDGSRDGIFKWRKATVTFKDLRWHRGEFFLNYSNVDSTILGDVYLDNPGQAHQIHFSAASTPGNPAAFTFGCRFHATETSQNIYILHYGSMTADLTKSFQFQISGDNSDYNGYFKVDKYAYAVFSHANATGNPEAPRADAVQLGDHARFAVKNGVTLNGARGITIIGDDVKITATNFTTHGATDCTSFTLAMPITGTKGFAKTGQGTVTLKGAYSAGPIVVENGTLTLNEAGSYPDGLQITVKAGARLLQRTFIPNIQVTCEPGGTWQRHLVVPYVSASQTATPLDLTTAPADLFPMEIQLSKKVDPLPDHPALRGRLSAGRADRRRLHGRYDQDLRAAAHVVQDRNRRPEPACALPCAQAGGAEQQGIPVHAWRPEQSRRRLLVQLRGWPSCGLRLSHDLCDVGAGQRAVCG